MKIPKQRRRLPASKGSPDDLPRDITHAFNEALSALVERVRLDWFDDEVVAGVEALTNAREAMTRFQLLADAHYQRVLNGL